jgi:ABC-2 type transport system permease protein
VLFYGVHCLFNVLSKTNRTLSQAIQVGLADAYTDLRKYDTAQNLLRSIFMTPMSPFLVLIAYTIWGLFLGSFSVIVFLFLGFFVFDITITGNFILAMIIIVISIVIMVGLGMVVAGLNVFLKNMEPVVRVLQETARFLCGVYFPLEGLPHFLRPVGKVIPVYYSIMGLRLALSDHASLSEIMYYIGILSVLAVAFMIFGMAFFKKSLNKARKDGSLAYY